MKQFVRKYDKKITDRITATRSASDVVRPVFSPRAFAQRCQSLRQFISRLKCGATLTDAA
jgi:hypothetical protein